MPANPSNTDNIIRLLGEAARLYGPSIDFSRVTVKGTSVAGGGRPWTANNTIRFPSLRKQPGTDPDLETLIHELAHVWQYQNGNIQLLKGLFEQIQGQLGRDPYNYGGAAGVRAAVAASLPLTTFSNESQAQIIQDYWSSQHGGVTGYTGEDFSPPYVGDMQTLISRAGIGTREPKGRNPVEGVVGMIVNGFLGLFRQ